MRIKELLEMFVEETYSMTLVNYFSLMLKNADIVVAQITEQVEQEGAATVEFTDPIGMQFPICDDICDEMFTDYTITITPDWYQYRSFVNDGDGVFEPSYTSEQFSY